MTVGDSDVSFHDTTVGTFAQDDWIVSPRLTLSYGLRSDWQSASSDLSLGARAGVAIAVDEARQNVIRIGTGSFYQRVEPEVTLDVLRQASQQQQMLIDHPSFFPSAPPNLAIEAASSATQRVADDALRTPEILMSAIGYDRQLGAKTFATLKYSYQHGSGLLRTRIFDAASVADTRAGLDAGRILQYESTGRLRRHELTSGWRWNGGERAALSVNYSYVHGRSDTDGRTTLPADGARLDDDFGPTAGDRTHAANVSAHFSLPGQLFVSPYVTAVSGRVFNITTGFDNNGDGAFTDRPALVAAGTPGAIVTSYGIFSANPAPGDLLVGRNAGREPGEVRVDLRLARAFRVAPRATFVIAANVENLFNRANYEGVNGVVASPSFGLPKRAALSRHLNLSANFNF
jgi:hypothetical protein